MRTKTTHTYSVYNSDKTLVKEANTLEMAEKMAKQLENVFGETFKIDIKYDVWASNYDR